MCALWLNFLAGRAMSKLIKIALIALILAAGLSSQVLCEAKKYGIGVILGEPSGLSGKMWRDENIAFDCGAAWSLTDDAGFNIHGDMLWHNWKVLDDAFDVDDSSRLPIYYGIGGRLKAGDDTKLGVRFVVGASYIFEYAPFDIFLEIVPVMDVVPKTELDMNASFGGRFWF